MAIHMSWISLDFFIILVIYRLDHGLVSVTAVNFVKGAKILVSGLGMVFFSDPRTMVG